MHVDAKGAKDWVSLNLDQSSKIKSKQHFQYIFENGQKTFCSHGLIISAKAYQDKGKFAVIASKKCGNAVKRNRLKRLFREFYRLNQSKLNANRDYLFIANPKIKSQFGFHELSQSLEAIFLDPPKTQKKPLKKNYI